MSAHDEMRLEALSRQLHKLTGFQLLFSAATFALALAALVLALVK